MKLRRKSDDFRRYEFYGLILLPTCCNMSSYVLEVKSVSDEFGNDFVTITDDDGNKYELEHLDTMEYNGNTYMAFLPVDMDENSEDYGIVILKVVEEAGEEVFANVDEQDELDAVYELYMERLFDGDEEE